MPNVIYRFVADGAPAVVRAFGDIEAAAAKARKATRSSVQAEQRTYQAAARKTSSRARGVSDETRAMEREAAAQIRAAERAASAKARIEERNRRYVARIRDRYFAEEQRAEEKQARALARRNERVAAQRTREVSQRQERFKGDLASAALGVGGAAVAAGVAMTGAAARAALTNEEKAAALSRAGRGAGEQAVDPTVLRREAEAVAAATPGIRAADLLDASAAFVGKTGDLKTARAMQGTMATVASATGANVVDIAGVAAELREKFKITDDADMKQALATLTMQGKAGSFELKDAADQYSKLGAAAAGFGLESGVAGITKLGGLTQIARSATGSPEQAAFALEATFRQLIANSDKLAAQGANVYNPDGSKRDITDILVDAVSKVGGTDTQAKDKGLQDIFGEQGIRALRPLIATFNEETRKGGDGVKALREQLDAAINVPGAWADVQQDAAAAQSGASARVVGAWEQITAKVGDQVLPTIAAFAERLAENEGAIDAFAGTVGVAVEALGALIEFLSGLPGIGEIFKRDQTPEKQRERVAKELARVDGMIEGRGGALAIDVADPLAQKKIRLENEIAALDAKMAAGPTVQGGPLSDEAFNAQYEAAGGTTWQKFTRASADPMNMAANVIPGLGTIRTLSQAFTDTDEQRSLVQRQEMATGAAEIQKQAEAAARLQEAASALKDAALAQKSNGIRNMFGIL